MIVDLETRLGAHLALFLMHGKFADSIRQSILRDHRTETTYGNISNQKRLCKVLDRL